MNPILTFPKLKDFNNLTKNQLNFPRTHTFVFKTTWDITQGHTTSLFKSGFLIALLNPVIPLLLLQPLCGNEKYFGEVLTFLLICLFLMG